QVAADFERALAGLSAQGWQLEEVALPFLGDFGGLTRILVSSEACRRHSPRFSQLESLGDPHILHRIMAGGSITEAEIAEARAERAGAMAAFAGFGAGFDAFLMPTVQVVAPLIADAQARFDRVN